MVVAGNVYNGGCCFDYGNMETNSHDNGDGTMEAVYFGTCTIWGKGAGDGPWVMGDLENGSMGRRSQPLRDSHADHLQFVLGMVKGDAGRQEPLGHQGRRCPGRQLEDAIRRPSPELLTTTR